MKTEPFRERFQKWRLLQPRIVLLCKADPLGSWCVRYWEAKTGLTVCACVGAKSFITFWQNKSGLFFAKISSVFERALDFKLPRILKCFQKDLIPPFKRVQCDSQTTSHMRRHMPDVGITLKNCLASIRFSEVSVATSRALQSSWYRCLFTSAEKIASSQMQMLSLSYFCLLRVVSKVWCRRQDYKCLRDYLLLATT